jgi:uncharacterized protein (TIGR02598 family)
MRLQAQILFLRGRGAHLHETAAFSLVEVALAIGLLAFCLISILGLLPVAMNVSVEAMDRNSKARMLQTIRADVLGADRVTLERSRTFFFDLQGNLVGRDNPPAGLNGSHFAVTLAPVVPTSLPGGQQSPHLQTMQLSILRQPQNSTVVTSLHVPDHGY